MSTNTTTNTHTCKDGVPTNNIISNLPGLITAASNDLSRLVAIINTHFCLRRRSFNWVNIAVVVVVVLV